MTTSHIHQSEFATLHKLTGPQVAALRKKHLTPEEWRKDGASILWTDEAAARVEALLLAENTFPADSPPAENTEPETPPSWLPNQKEKEKADAKDASPAESINAETIGTKNLIVSARVLKKARNYLYVYAAIQSENTGEVERVAVFCSKKSRKGLLGKTINVRVETIEGETRYFHQP